jgi:hypothetical protein
MSVRLVLCAVIIVTVALPSVAPAQTAAGRRAAAQTRRAEQVLRQREENQAYLRAQRALDDSRWAEAAELFSRLAAVNGTRRDAALYWKAYAQNRLGQRAEALATLAELQSTAPNSRYTTQARALEVEVRSDAGQPVPPEGQQDEGVRLIALQGLLRSDPDRAAPMLDRILRSTAAPRLKTRALFLVAQNDAPSVRDVLAAVAHGEAGPELQLRAIDLAGARQTPESRALLADVYAASSDLPVKRRVMRAFTRAGDAESLVGLARREADPARKRELVQNLSLMRNKVALDYLAELAR